jgi:hypothetical protein
VSTSEERRSLISRIDKFITDLETRPEPPDRWESARTAYAIGFLLHGNLSMAQREISFAQFPHELRPPAEVVIVPPIFAKVTPSQLRQTFDETLNRLVAPIPDGRSKR